MSVGTLPPHKGAVTNGKTPLSAWFFPALTSTIGSKFLVAITGAILVGFLCGHLAGNLLIFKGPDALNSYARGLKDLGGLLWVARIGLLVAFVLHVFLAVRLQMRNREARPERYQYPGTVQATTASVTMLYSGLLILAFVVYHLAHYTFGLVHETEDGKNLLELHDKLGRHDVYEMTRIGFSKWWVTLSYVVAQVVLWFHLSHGISSTFQTLGWNAPKYWSLIRSAGLLLATIIVTGNILIPTAVLLGWVR
jgi:succinate dehydrogenase / fumarate reductase, cytochrome b subunit